MEKFRKTIGILLFSFAAIGLSACETKSPSEQTGGETTQQPQQQQYPEQGGGAMEQPEGTQR